MSISYLTETLQNVFWHRAEALMFRHTNPWELDEALTLWGYTLGPCAAQDLVGLDVVLAGSSKRDIPILPRMVSEGRLGKKVGVGYYRYPGGGGAVIDPLIEDLILEEAWFGKITRDEISQEALVVQMNQSLQHDCQSALTKGFDKAAIHQALQDAVHFPKSKKLGTAGILA